MIVFKNPKFVKTAVHFKDFPLLKSPSGKQLPEIAVGGRSNVGKSSLLNHLFRCKRLVKVSSTPGKTQTLNFFTVNDHLGFVDLPGYGYAKVPISVQKQWGPMVQTYLLKRKSLKLFLFLFDIRRMPNEKDKQLLEWAAFHQIAMIFILTKVDKVNRREKEIYTKRILEAFHAKNLHYLYYSVAKNIGRHPLIAMIKDALEGEI